MILSDSVPTPIPLRASVREAYHQDETSRVEAILAAAELPSEMLDRIGARARALVATVRAARVGKGGVDAFLHEYELSSQEGVVLMCLAEALLRIPDSDTVDRLIRDKIGPADWQRHVGQSSSLFVNASTWALMLTGRVVKLEGQTGEASSILKRLITRSGEPVIRQAVTAAMRILGRQFVMGRTIGEALDRARSPEKQGYRHSYDMLGEAARTAADASRYFDSYRDAIASIGGAAAGRPIADVPSISVKLSALHPRYEVAKRRRVLAELLPRIKQLALEAKRVGIGFTIDAEEADRLDLSLDLIEALALDPDLAGWDGFGLAVQAYQTRALPLIDWLADLARRGRRRLMVRLVKGAYWDTEIKRAQEWGLATYPVYTRKATTDVSYLACAKRLLAASDAFYAQFATHNAQTVSAIIEIGGNSGIYEFQRLHGMGEALYEQIVGPGKLDRPCRVYAPVGSHEDLLAYLVRRLLENGANSSFVNRLVDERAPIDEIVADPIARVRALRVKPHPGIPLPRQLYMAGQDAPERLNSQGRDLADVPSLVELDQRMAKAAARSRTAASILGGVEATGAAAPVTDPADRRRVVGSVVVAGTAEVDRAVARASRAATAWDAAGGAVRAEPLERAADLMEAEAPELMTLIVREGGRTVSDAQDEVREAIDFCRYYAGLARRDFGEVVLPGPTGERNTYRLAGRGVFACISPWNFPLAIFVGQVAAALAAGNTVVAKPAEQTPLIAAEAVRLLHRAGVPADALQLVPGDGRVGAALVADRRIAGVVFTGSTATARTINRVLAGRDGPIVPLIAETGGLNVMIADSSALVEQVVADIFRSAFNSAGQRCSALRVLFVQTDIADRVLGMLAGGLAELTLGDPADLATDVGPVIDEAARAVLDDHARRMAAEARLVVEAPLPPGTEHGTFFAPRIFEIERLSQLPDEVFGPILHVVRWRGDRLDDVLAEIQASGYGLTLGIHSRIDETVRRVTAAARVGNLYVNRNMVGAVVGVQPFGGEGLSGTGPKAGGPRYLARFATERSVSIDTTAAGGNASLMSLDDGAA
ncbi:MAG TPA: bifunctional proline dehydrogenase/L-glutamate gamma-semialdehyde dehydrogenase PutA [Stellaceae bacterium]|nr:bifunctional proline dehydrogenase/L-glutamate gamma-semialdehyde dehydrogenase PutA [Stellaceae bacterium]